MRWGVVQDNVSMHVVYCLIDFYYFFSFLLFACSYLFYYWGEF